MGHMMTDADERSSTKEEAMRRALGRRIVEIRRRQGMSQAELARRLGVESCRLSHWERGFHLPSLVQVAELAAALQAGLDELILGKSPQTSEAILSRQQRDRLAVCLRTAMEVLRAEESRERRTRAARPGAQVNKSGSPRQSR